MLLNFAIKTIINGIALWVAARIVDGIDLAEKASTSGSAIGTVLLVAVVFGILNTFVRPIAKVVSLPFIIVTLGLFVFIINALMLELTSWLAGKLGLDFHVQSFFWDAVLGALIITLVSMILGFLNPRRD